MCTNPITIKSRSSHWNRYKPLTLSVPCGKCFECQSNRRNEWFVRSYFEWKQSEMAFFYTLTFDNEWLPKLYNVPVFCKRYVQLFLKRLRKALEPFQIKLRYIITSEFGELHQRPHHHANFFLDGYINPYTFYKLVEDAWIYGFVKSGANLGRIDKDTGIFYVTKYITKDMFFMSGSFKHIADNLQQHMDKFLLRYYRLYGFSDMCLKVQKTKVVAYAPYRKVDEVEQARFNRFSRHFQRVLSDALPFHLQSRYLGWDGFNNSLSQVDFLREQISIVRSTGLCQHFSLPRLFARKLWYDAVESETTHKNTNFVLNEKGIKHKLEKLEYDLPSIKADLLSKALQAKKYDLNSEFVRYYYTTRDDFQSKKGFPFATSASLHRFIEHSMNDLDFDVLAIYSVVFRGRVSTFPSDFVWSADLVKTNYLDIVRFQLDDLDDMDFGKLYENRKLFQSFEPLLFDYIPYFRPYELFLQTINAIDLVERRKLSHLRQTSENDASRVRQLLLTL